MTWRKIRLPDKTYSSSMGGRDPKSMPWVSVDSSAFSPSPRDQLLFLNWTASRPQVEAHDPVEPGKAMFGVRLTRQRLAAPVQRFLQFGLHVFPPESR